MSFKCFRLSAVGWCCCHCRRCVVNNPPRSQQPPVSQLESARWMITFFCISCHLNKSSPSQLNVLECWKMIKCCNGKMKNIRTAVVADAYFPLIGGNVTEMTKTVYIEETMPSQLFNVLLELKFVMNSISGWDCELYEDRIWLIIIVQSVSASHNYMFVILKITIFYSCKEIREHPKYLCV